MSERLPDLPVVAKNASSNVEVLEEFESHIPTLSTPELVDGYLGIKDLSNKIKKMTDLIRVEFLDGIEDDVGRFFKAQASMDERGHLYLKGYEKELKAEKRVSKPVLKQEEAIQFFEEKGLLGKVAEVDVNLSHEDVEQLLVLSQMIGPMVTDRPLRVRLAERLGLKPKPLDQEKAYELLMDIVDKLQAKGKLKVSQEKVEALVALEEISVDEVEGLFETKITYALKESNYPHEY